MHMYYKYIMRHLDLALLQTFVAIADNGSFTQAAKQVHRTQSAVSLQMQRLEAVAGAPLFKKTGRQMETTDAGDLLLNHARTLLALNDETLHALRGMTIRGHGAPGRADRRGRRFSSGNTQDILRHPCASETRSRRRTSDDWSRHFVPGSRRRSRLVKCPEAKCWGSKVIA